MIYYLVLVTTLAACRLESTTEFCTDRSCDIPNSAKSEADSSKSNKNIDGGNIYTTAEVEFTNHMGRRSQYRAQDL